MSDLITKYLDFVIEGIVIGAVSSVIISNPDVPGRDAVLLFCWVFGIVGIVCLLFSVWARISGLLKW